MPITALRSTDPSFDDPIQSTNQALHTAVIPIGPAEIIDDYTTNGVIYHFIAPPGSNPADPVWYGEKFTVATGRVTHADGNAEFDNIADNRASLTYA